MKIIAFFGLFLLGAAASNGAGLANLVANGSFESSQAKSGVPDYWATAGNPAISQQLTLDTGRDGKQCAKLEYTKFQGDGPDSHVMICQVRQVSVRKGQWYRLNFWARAQAIKGACDVALVNTRRWDNIGLAEVFTARTAWERFEFLFQAKNDLPANDSRLQFWFKGTGMLWLDDVVLAESDQGRQWFPQIATEHIVKFAAITFAHGVRKLFFHAGTCGTINAPDEGGVIFEYGGAPRKMLAGVATLTRLLGVPDEFVRQVKHGSLTAYVFRRQDRWIIVAWCSAGQTEVLSLNSNTRAYDIMGNEITARRLSLSETPVYLLAEKADLLNEIWK